MKTSTRWIVAAAIACIALPACSRTTEVASGKPAPATVDAIEGAEVSRVTLTAKAAERLQIRTQAVRARRGTARLAIPYSALLYDADGTTWTYTSPKPLTYVRARVDVVRIDGQTALLRSGPRTGTLVVTVGAAELYGVEFGVGK